MDTSAPVHPYGQDLRMLQFVPEPAPLPAALQASLPAAARASLPSAHAPSTSASDFGPFSLSPPHAAVPPAGIAPPAPRSTLSPLNLPTSHPAPTSSTCHLLLLPPELLDQVLALVLPYTTHTSKGIAWVRCSTALLATCGALHAAGARHLYGTNTFVLRTSFTGTKWHCAWIRPRSAFLRSSSHAQVLQRFIDTARVTAGERPYGGPPAVRGTLSAFGRRGAADDPAPLVPSRLLPFPAALPARYRPLLRKVALTVQVEDAYTGEIKYGFGGPGLADGVRAQVAALADVLGEAHELHRLVVRVAGVGVGRAAEERRILAPLLDGNQVRVRDGGREVEGGWPV